MSSPRFPRSVTRFLRDETAALSVEAAVILPVMGIFYVGSFSYFDAYRREAVLTKASYAIGDLLSREEGTVTVNDFEGMQDVFEFMTFSEGETRLRFTELRRDGETLEIVWSYGTDGSQVMTDSILAGLQSQVPSLLDNERIVIVESFNDYVPFFNVGLQDRTLTRFVSTRQRYTARLDYDDTVPLTSVQLTSGQ